MIPPSPVITSIRPTLLNIIGPDVYKIIEDYKESNERFEKNFTDIDKCLVNKSDFRHYDMTINLYELHDYCIEKYNNLRIQFKINIDNRINTSSYELESLKPLFLKMIPVEKIKYKIRFDDSPWLEIFLGKYIEKDINFIQKILFSVLFNYSPIHNYSGGLDLIYDNDYMEDFYKKYINKNNNEIQLIEQNILNFNLH